MQSWYKSRRADWLLKKKEKSFQLWFFWKSTMLDRPVIGLYVDAIITMTMRCRAHQHFTPHTKTKQKIKHLTMHISQSNTKPHPSGFTQTVGGPCPVFDQKKPLRVNMRGRQTEGRRQDGKLGCRICMTSHILLLSLCWCVFLWPLFLPCNSV